MAILHLNFMFIKDLETGVTIQVVLGDEGVTYSGEDRQQITASGDLRVISTPIEFRDLDYSISKIDRETFYSLNDMRGHLVLMRTPRGWKQWAVLTGVAGSEILEQDALSVSLTLLEVSFNETV
jgi:hypothetical protein